jgi:hypothetical protein
MPSASGGESGWGALDALDLADRSRGDGNGARHVVFGLVAGSLPAHPRRTRRKYVPVGSYAASMPRKVSRRWAGKDPSRWSVCVALLKATSKISGAVSSPIAGPCDGMDAATEPARTDSRRVAQAARAPRARLTRLLTWIFDRYARVLDEASEHSRVLALLGAVSHAKRQSLRYRVHAVGARLHERRDW